MPAQIVNMTPFPHLRYSSSDNRGLEFGVLVLKATLSIGDDGVCTIADEQEAINRSDVPHGERNKSSLKHPSEFVGYKPATDVIINATAYAPKGEAAPTWPVGVDISDQRGPRARKILNVHGPRSWFPKWKRDLTDEEKREWKRHRDLFQGWELSEGEPITSLPIQYEYAYGGDVPSGVDQEGNVTFLPFDYNHIGKGIIEREWSDHTKAIPAPQIEYASEPITDPYKRYYPAGYGAIPPVWLPRRPLGGTFDKAWADNVWPKWPTDYDFSYNNSAAADLAIKDFLYGDIRLTLFNMNAKRHRWDILIPELAPLLVMENTSGENIFVHPNLDTVFVEVEAADSFEHHISLTWRLVFNMEETTEIGIALLDKPTLQRLTSQYVAISSNPHPSICSVYSDALERPA